MSASKIQFQHTINANSQRTVAHFGVHDAIALRQVEANDCQIAFMQNCVTAVANPPELDPLGCSLLNERGLARQV